MDNIIYDALKSYYNALEKKGYMADHYWQKLLVLLFYRDFVFGDSRGLLSKEDYRLIERALECLWGTACLIPYPDYLKTMGKLHLGETTELSQRIKKLEEVSMETASIIRNLKGLEELKNLGDVTAIVEELEELKALVQNTPIPKVIELTEYIDTEKQMPVSNLYTFEGLPVSHMRVIQDQYIYWLLFCVEHIDGIENLGTLYLVFSTDTKSHPTYATFEESYDVDTVPDWVLKAFNEKRN